MSFVLLLEMCVIVHLLGGKKEHVKYKNLSANKIHNDLWPLQLEEVFVLITN